MFVRWEGQEVEREREARLPGLEAQTTTRTFDAPEAMGVRFHEVEARSALNSVPGDSLPFNWTVNPYRGCSHACTYCVAPSTPVLLADGRSRPISELAVGDEIYGTVREGVYRRYVKTRVFAHWRTKKVAFRVTLCDGTELVASGDHRFLTNRGWKFVTGAENGRNRRPHLTENVKLMGTGKLVPAPIETDAYRRGYLCGMVRGDGHIGTYAYQRQGRTNGDVHRFRLALADFAALERTEAYLTGFGVPTKRFQFSPATAKHREVQAIRTSAEASVDRVRELIRWPAFHEPEWSVGFLAGIFDAEGSSGQGILRIANSDDEILHRTTLCLNELGFNTVLEGRQGTTVRTVRVRGGTREQLRFFLATDPAIERKRSIEGRAIKSQAPLDVVAIEPLGTRMTMFDITTGTGDFIADGVVSHNCFARPTHRYLDLNAREDFEREIVVKVNVPERLRTELKRPSWKGETVALGTNTDPYQWVEGRYGLTRAIWEVLIEARNSGSVLTKSPLLLRDIDLFKELVEVAGFQASLSIPTIDEAAWRASEPRTPHPLKRIEAVAELNRAGIPAGVLIAPLMPGINDSPEQVEEILRLCTEAGATSVGGLGLHLKGEVREIFLDWLRGYRPDLLPRYEQLYRSGAFMPAEERQRISRMLAKGPRSSDFREPRRARERRRAAQAREDAWSGRAARPAAALALLAGGGRRPARRQRADPPPEREREDAGAEGRQPGNRERAPVPAERRGGAGDRRAEPDAEVEAGGEGAHRDAAPILGDPVDHHQDEAREHQRERGAHGDRADQGDDQALGQRDRDQPRGLDDPRPDRAARRSVAVGHPARQDPRRDDRHGEGREDGGPAADPALVEVEDDEAGERRVAQGRQRHRQPGPDRLSREQPRSTLRLGRPGGSRRLRDAARDQRSRAAAPAAANAQTAS